MKQRGKTARGDSRASASTIGRRGVTRRGLMRGGKAAVVAATAGLGPNDHAAAQPGRVTTITFSNSGGSPEPANIVTKAFGHAFRKGDIPAGSYPRFELPDGRECPMSWWNRATYDDGSWRFAGFVLLIPVGIPANGSIQLNVMATTKAPAATARRISDLNRYDLKIEAVGRKNISGLWVSSVNQGIVDGDDIEDLSDPTNGRGGGPIAKVYRIGQGFLQNGKDHDSLYTWFYVFILQDRSGDLYGIRVLPGYSMPWLQPGDTSYKAFDRVDLMQGAKRIAQVPLVEQQFELSYVSGDGFTKTGSDAVTCAFRVASSGNLPEGLVAGEVYGLMSAWKAEDCRVNTHGPGGALFNYTVGRSGYIQPKRGTGKLTAQVLPFVGRLVVSFICDPSAEYAFIPHGSANTESSLTPLHHRAYLRSTALIPALPLDVPTIRDSTQLSYYWGQSPRNAIYIAEPDTGGRTTLGPIHRLHAEHFSFQSAQNWRNCMVLGLQAGWRHVVGMDRTTRSMMRVRNGDYPGMAGISMVGYRFYPGQALPDGVDPEFNGNDVQLRVRGGWLVYKDTSHTNCLAPYPYLISGRPEIADLLAYTAIDRIASQPPHHRDFSYRGRSYGGVFALMDGQSRDTAWAIRDVMSAAVMLADESMYKRHLVDCLDDTIELMVACRPDADPLLDRIGVPWHYAMTGKQFWNPAPGHMFSFLYQLNMLIWLSRVCPGEKMDLIIKQIQKIATHFWNRKQVYSNASYGTRWRLGANYQDFATQDAQIGEPFSFSQCAWSDQTSRIRVTGLSGDAKPIGRIVRISNGDQICLHVGNISGLDLGKVYFVRDVEGDSFSLSLSLGGQKAKIATSGSGPLMFTGIFAAGLNRSHYTDVPTIAQYQSLCRMLRSLRGKAVVPDDLVSAVDDWMHWAGEGGKGRDQHRQFMAESWSG